MPSFTVDREQVNAFKVHETYLVKEYFDQDDLFTQLEKHYNRDRYRFEIPEDKLEKVRQVLDEFFYDLEIADEFTEYCVVLGREEDAEPVLRNAVMTKRQGDCTVCLMKDELSVQQAVEHGAVPVAESLITMEDLAWKIDGS